MVSLRTLALGSMLAVGTMANAIFARAVNPGPVKGDTFIHDPTVVKKLLSRRFHCQRHWSEDLQRPNNMA
jgi:hypothetical protein